MPRKRKPEPVATCPHCKKELNNPILDPWLTVNQAAEVLQEHPVTIRRRVKSGSLPAHYVAPENEGERYKQVRIRASDVSNLMGEPVELDPDWMNWVPLRDGGRVGQPPKQLAPDMEPAKRKKPGSLGHTKKLLSSNKKKKITKRK